MVRAVKSQTKRRENRLYRAAKISEYQFKRVLAIIGLTYHDGKWQTIRDRPALRLR